MADEKSPGFRLLIHTLKFVLPYVSNTDRILDLKDHLLDDVLLNMNLEEIKDCLQFARRYGILKIIKVTELFAKAKDIEICRLLMTEYADLFDESSLDLIEIHFDSFEKDGKSLNSKEKIKLFHQYWSDDQSYIDNEGDENYE